MKSAIRVRRGLQVPVAGVPQQEISELSGFRHVGLVGDDYVGLKPTMHVKVGDRVLKGQCLFEDKNNAGVRFTAPARDAGNAANGTRRRGQCPRRRSDIALAR